MSGRRMKKGAAIVFEATGEFRAPKRGEWFVSQSGDIVREDTGFGWSTEAYDRRTILERATHVRKPRPAAEPPHAE